MSKSLICRIEDLENAADLDEQTLAIDGCDLSISNGNTVELPLNDYPVYRLTQPPTGVNRRVWDSADALPNGDVDGIWTGPADPDTTFPSHPNPWTSQNIEADWAITTGDLGNNPTDQMEAWGWIDTTGLGPILLRDNNGNTGEFGEYWIGACCGPPVRQAGFNDASTGDTDGADRSLLDPTQPLGEGLHFIYARQSDLSAFGGFGTQYTTDLTGAGGWANFPTARSFTEKPSIECQTVPGCDPVPEGWELCQPVLCSPAIPPDIDAGLDPSLLPQAATTLPVADNEDDVSLRTGQIGTSADYARADHNHPVVRQANPGDPVPDVGGNMATTQTIILDRWSTEETYSYAFRMRVQQDAGGGWGWVNVPTIVGFQQPRILQIGGYRPAGTAPQVDETTGTGGDGAAPRGAYMGQEFHHWTSSRRIYGAYNRRDNAVDTYLEFIVEYIRT